MQNLAPIALFVYNRPDHTRRTLSYLQQNVLAEESRLFIFADAAKTEADIAKTEQVMQLIKAVSGFKSVKIIARKANFGLANSIIDGVTQLVNEYGKVIVFEDDLLSSPYTLKYFNEALDKYSSNEEVMHIGAYMFGLGDKTLPPTFFHYIATSWGWATWARAWKNFEPNIDTLLQQFDKEKIHRFSVDGTMNFWKQMGEFKTGRNNSWAIRWYASIFLRGGLSLNPSKSLINSIGNDGSGIHSNIDDVYQVQISREPVSQFPPDIVINKQAHAALKKFLKNRKGSLWARGLRLMNQMRVKHFSKKK